MLGAINFFLCVPSIVPRNWGKVIVCVLFIFKNTVMKEIHIHCRECLNMQKIIEKKNQIYHNPSTQM